MPDRVILTTLIALGVLLGVTLVVQLRWVKDRKFKTGLVFLAGVVVILTLRMGGVPPSWFEGGWEGFGLAGSFVLAGLVTKGGEERTFGLPLFLGLGLTLLALNVLQFIDNVL